ncbi:MAG TPA: hypothetical protein VI588_04930, partial [Candidatus Gracilibacteria bacterium]|nr:hypothetical protein [Candidatus Gracilibacteria bacterium]
MNARFDWRNPASDGEKLKMIAEHFGKGWGDEMDTVLRYEVGNIDGVTKEESKELVRLFFASGDAQ